MAKVHYILDFEKQFYFPCTEDKYILDAAEDFGIMGLPYSDRAGAGFTSAARLISGQIDQSEDWILDDAQKAAGFFLTDNTYPLSDCVVKFFAEEELQNWVPGTV
ncbi:ferredoxin [Pectobacterium aroidearum]|uniref:ferredoxin n=1 Tax=Pectobacterium aroidearum TaxID=1201031 RepID=UPI0021155E17|nr:ferredoxin [Pectobacterium aroidearum]UUE59189.1 ferredoxin [Pectobacterium aroidearum]UUE72016.1 ferredoxin [Pectobacterium aroidearum]UUE76415.1 ferredoxin [Pectobacterium aroidearum]UUE80641.1 ferredoxin [Pectobacterium aroidearum]